MTKGKISRYNQWYAEHVDWLVFRYGLTERQALLVITDIDTIKEAWEWVEAEEFIQTGLCYLEDE